MILKLSDQNNFNIKLIIMTHEIEYYINSDIIIFKWKKTEHFRFNQFKIVENNKFNIGKDSDIGDSKFESNIKYMTINMINDHYDQYLSKYVRVIYPINTLFSSQNIINMKYSTSI